MAMAMAMAMAIAMGGVDCEIRAMDTLFGNED